MSRYLRICLVELRPWPFGPPLQGRAKLNETNTKKTNKKCQTEIRT
jgi:hypothetical protein